MGGPEIDHLIALLSKLPGMGPRSARRAALKMLQQPESRMLPLAAALAQAARAVRPCSARGHSTICVVEGVCDLWALARAGVHHGLYHVLGVTLSAMSGIGPEDLNVTSLLSRIAQGNMAEGILARGAAVAGAPPADWLTDQLRPTGVEITRVGQGVPMGGALDVLDDGTLAAALRTRRAT